MIYPPTTSANKQTTCSSCCGADDVNDWWEADERKNRRPKSIIATNKHTKLALRRTTLREALILNKGAQKREAEHMLWSVRDHRWCWMPRCNVEGLSDSMWVCIRPLDACLLFSPHRDLDISEKQLARPQSEASWTHTHTLTLFDLSLVHLFFGMNNNAVQSLSLFFLERVVRFNWTLSITSASGDGRCAAAVWQCEPVRYGLPRPCKLTAEANCSIPFSKMNTCENTLKK